MTSICATPLKGRVIRLIKLDVCGNPVTGASSAVVVMDGFISMKATPQFEDGTTYIKKRADGLLCVNQMDPSQMKWVDLDGDWCVMDPDAIVLMNGARLISQSATGTGAIFNNITTVNQHFSLEIWQEVAGAGACNAAGIQQFIYWAFPNVFNARVQDFTAEQDALEWKEQATALASVSTRWGSLPTANPPSSYLSGSSFQTGDVYGYNLTTTPPPAASCGAVLLA